jgi:hypothetical protein
MRTLVMFLALIATTACPAPPGPHSYTASCQHAPARVACDRIPAIAIADLPAQASRLKGRRVRITGPLHSVLIWCDGEDCPRSDVLAIEQIGPPRTIVGLDQLYCVHAAGDRNCCPLEPNGQPVSAVGELNATRADRWWSLKKAVLCDDNPGVAP